MTDYNWVHGDNGYQEYYEADTPDGTICVYKTHPLTKWVAQVPGGLVWSKRWHDKQRRKQHLPEGADMSMLRVHTPLQYASASTMKKKAIEAYETGVYEL